MTEDEATVITASLFRMYPSATATAETFKGYVEFFAGLHDAAQAIEAVNDVVLVGNWLPTVAALNEAYKSRLARKFASLPALEAAEFDDEGLPMPQTPQEWERLAERHRKLRARDFSETEDPAWGKPLPRSRSEFSKEWADFVILRFGGQPAVKGMEP